MFQEKYELEEIMPVLSDIDLIFLGSKRDERSLHLKKSFDSFKGDYIHLKADYSFDKIDVTIEENGGYTSELFKNETLVSGIPNLLKQLEIRQKKVLIDITGMQHVVLFFLIKILLTHTNPKLLVAGYTEPEVYIEEDVTSGSFELSEHRLGCEESLPGFSRRDRGHDKILIPLLGFEGHRLLFLLEDIQPTLKTIEPIVGFPSYSPGWKIKAIISNHRALAMYGCYGNIKLCEASSPFRLFRLLSHLSKIHDGCELLIAPLGTRPHALGAAIYVSLNSNCNLIYDFPVEKENVSKGVSTVYIYNLTNYISEPYDEI